MSVWLWIVKGKGGENDWQNYGGISNTEEGLGMWENLNAAWGTYETFGKIFQESIWINNSIVFWYLAGWL